MHRSTSPRMMMMTAISPDPSTAGSCWKPPEGVRSSGVGNTVGTMTEVVVTDDDIFTAE